MLAFLSDKVILYRFIGVNMKNKHAQKLGSLGGKARAKSLTKEQLLEISKKGNNAKKMKKNIITIMILGMVLMPALAFASGSNVPLALTDEQGQKFLVKFGHVYPVVFPQTTFEEVLVAEEWFAIHNREIKLANDVKATNILREFCQKMLVILN